MDHMLLRFRYPSDEILASLRDIIAGLDVCDPPRFAEPEIVETDAVRGDLEAVVGSLAENLRRDFAENDRESSSWNGGFDYLVVPSARVDGALEIKTRLYSTADSSQGDVFYSRIVERVADDGFLLWTSE
jgi:hypothetical protein